MDIRNYFNPVGSKKSTKRKKDNEQSKKEDDDNSNKRMKVIDPSTYFAKKGNSEKEKQKRKIESDKDDNTSFDTVNSKKNKVKTVSKKNEVDLTVIEDTDKLKKKLSTKVKPKETAKIEEKIPEPPVKKRTINKTKSDISDNKELEQKSKPVKAKIENIEDELMEEEKPKKKFNYRAYLAKKNAGPKAPGSKIIPKGKEDCLLGMTFVFTGDLSSISRDEATDLVKRYGGPNDALLWVDKYKPKDVSEIIGHKTNLDRIRSWLKEWKTGTIFKKDSPKALLLSGPPGIGKTTAAILCSEAEGFKPIEFNASDARSKNILKNTLSDLIGNHTMTEYFDQNTKSKKKQINDDIKNVIIMDEVDGMSSGDRGGNAELIQMIKKTKTPIICICNDRQSPKIRTLANYTLDLRFRRPDASAIMRRIGPICQKEGLHFQTNSIEQIIQSTQSDIRQVLNALATYRLKATSISYDDSKELAKKSEKDFSQNPFSLVQKFFNLSEYRNSTFADRMDYFFEDYELMPLMVQENYLQIYPALAKDERGRQDPIKLLNLMSEASDSIAYGDIINSTLRRTNNWSLLSVQGSFSCARPSYFVHGMARGQYNFPGWLGQNSKAGKYKRCLHEIYSHSCQKDGIPDVIKIMDSYYISKEDFDMIMELGVGDKSGEKLLKKIDTNTKRTFTRL
ncbi:hypothetical protein PIROE2DRAFT_68911 [Piromyces sp. E2]|nr:hypothetical protein PIROE2DRAFT_68911 [Piromyces sp. E2]|eukprot:OUM66743.1 hypothetical protein PIROE2DRAFT_68911 [Piromyces sp. E2]